MIVISYIMYGGNSDTFIIEGGNSNIYDNLGGNSDINRSFKYHSYLTSPSPVTYTFKT
jgi:hypothetical protein